MEAKRMKLDHNDEDSRDSNSLSSCSVASTSAAPSEIPGDGLSSKDPAEVEQALKKLKTTLRSKAAIQRFMESSSDTLSAVIAVLVKSAVDIGSKNPAWLTVLKESISVVANCCNYSIAACLKMAASRVAFTHIAVRVFESSSVKQDCKTSMARLIANMCLHKEPAYCIASNPSLVDRLVLMLDADDPTAAHALRAVRGLVASTYIKVVLLSNAGFYLGKMLAAGRSVAHVIAVLTVLARRRVRDTGRQLAGSDCAERLLELFFSNEVQGAKELVLVLCEGSTDMRDRMGDARAIRRIVESAEDSATNCKLLAAFAQEAWGRADLRESGALDFLISRLSSTSITSSDRLAIVQPLRHFVHDTNGMAHLVRNRMFIDTVVNDVDEFLATFKFECKAEVIADQDIYRPDSPLLMEIESGLQKKGDSEASSRLHKDYSSLWAYSSPSPARSPWSSSSSPSYSPPSSGAASPVSALSISPFASPHSSHSRLSDLGADAGDGESSIGQGDARHEPSGSLALNAAAEKVIESELWLLNWQAQEDANLPYLGREDVVNAVLSYIALAPSPDYRIGRILRRLACSRHSIDSLLSMQFHTRVLHTLCIVPCRVVRFAKRCGRCERAAEFGREILREFASHVDSDYGDSFLNKRLSSEDFTTRVVAAIAKVALIRDRFRLCRVASVRLPALDLLFDSIRSLLLRNDFIEVSSESTYVDGPPLGAQMVGAISTLISPQRLREILEVDAAVRPQERSECVVKSCGENSDVEMLVFETKEGEVLARVPMQAACESSRYFEGMFTADLFEKCSGQRSFVFNPEEEDCSAEDFTRFLHYMAGCRSLCTAISSAHTCVALVKLSDRYLCPALSDFICSPHGPVRRILTGETLPVFLPAVLTTQTHSRLVAMCLLTLVRYSSSSQVIEALRSICLSPLLVDSFIEQMRILTT